MDLITNDKSRFVERISKAGLTSKKSQHNFLVVRSAETSRVTNLIFFTFHGSAAYYPTNTISTRILADATWNAASALSEVPILNQSWLTWAAGPSRTANRALNETLAARGYPNLQKGRATQAAGGYVGLRKALDIQAAAGYPGLQKTRDIQAALGYPNLQKARDIRTAGGYTSL